MVETYVNFIIFLFLRSASDIYDDQPSTRWPRNMNDFYETHVSDSWWKASKESSSVELSHTKLDELLAIGYQPSSTESASSTSQANKSDAVHDLIEPMTSMCLAHDPEEKNELEEHVLQTINNLSIQLRNDLSNEKDLKTKLEDKSHLDLQVCLFDPMNYSQVSNAFF